MTAGRGHGSLPAALLTASVAIAFADASIVVLALPAIYGEFDVSIVGVSWVITIYAVTVAIVAAAVRLATGPRSGLPTLPPRLLTATGLGLFTISSLACGAASTLGALLAGRVGQGAGAGLLLIGALAVLETLGPAGRGHRLWATAALGGLALGPALGGVLTEAFEWQAIFFAQAPVAALGLVAVLRRPPAGPERAVTIELPEIPRVEPVRDQPAGSASATAAAAKEAVLSDVTAVFVSGAMVGALFLAVLLVIEVWRYSPAEGALTVSTLPVGALLVRWFQRRAPASVRLGLGIPLLAVGLVAVALLPAAEPLLLASALALCGAGLGLALDVLDPISIRPELGVLRSTAASVLARHAGLVLGLVVIAPVLSGSLQSGAEEAALAGTYTVLEAEIDVRAKIEIARNLRDVVDATPRGQMPNLDAAVLGGEGDSGDSGDRDADRVQLADNLTNRVEGILTRRFRASFAIGALLALLALVPALTLLRLRQPDTRVAPSLATAALAVAVVAGGVLVGGELAAGALTYGDYDAADPCTASPDTFGGGGFDGILQRVALGALNGAACELDVTREQLVLSLDQDSSLAVVTFDDDTLNRALEAGALRALDDAQDRGTLPGPLAAVIRQAIRVAPLGWLAEQLDLPIGGS